jgi:hypothetical protein
MLFYTCTIWFARLSIVFSVTRIVPPARSVSVSALGAGGVLVCLWAYMLTSKSVVCAVDKSWYDAVVIICPMPSWVALSEVCSTCVSTTLKSLTCSPCYSADTLSDVILVVLPLRLLWRVKLPSNQRIMVFSVFSTSILVSVVSVVHTSYLIPSVTVIGVDTAQFEVRTPPCSRPCILSSTHATTKQLRYINRAQSLLSSAIFSSSSRSSTASLEMAETSPLAFLTRTPGLRTASPPSISTSPEVLGSCRRLARNPVGPDAQAQRSRGQMFRVSGSPACATRTQRLAPLQVDLFFLHGHEYTTDYHELITVAFGFHSTRQSPQTPED